MNQPINEQTKDEQDTKQEEVWSKKSIDERYEWMDNHNQKLCPPQTGSDRFDQGARKKVGCMRVVLQDWDNDDKKKDEDEEGKRREEGKLWCRWRWRVRYIVICAVLVGRDCDCVIRRSLTPTNPSSYSEKRSNPSYMLFVVIRITSERQI